MLTIAPSCFASSGAASWQMKSGARRLEPMSSSQCEDSIAPTATGKKLEALFTSEVEAAEALAAPPITSARGAIGASSSAFTRAALFARAAFSSASSFAASASESR